MLRRWRWIWQRTYSRSRGPIERGASSTANASRDVNSSGCSTRSSQLGAGASGADMRRQIAMLRPTSAGGRTELLAEGLSGISQTSAIRVGSSLSRRHAGGRCVGPNTTAGHVAASSVAHGHAIEGAAATPGTPKVFQRQTLRSAPHPDAGVHRRTSSRLSGAARNVEKGSQRQAAGR